MLVATTHTFQWVLGALFDSDLIKNPMLEFQGEMVWSSGREREFVMDQLQHFDGEIRHEALIFFGHACKFLPAKKGKSWGGGKQKLEDNAKHLSCSLF